MFPHFNCNVHLHSYLATLQQTENSTACGLFGLFGTVAVHFKIGLGISGRNKNVTLILLLPAWTILKGTHECHFINLKDFSCRTWTTNKITDKILKKTWEIFISHFWVMLNQFWHKEHIFPKWDFEVVTAANMKITVFWVVAPCCLVEVFRRFRSRKHLCNVGKFLPGWTAQQPGRQLSSENTQ
jgi:hypothetical protein